MLKIGFQRYIQSLQSILKKSSNKDTLNELILISGKFHKMNDEINLGVVSRNDYNYEVNRIRSTLLEFITEIERKQTREYPLVQEKIIPLIQEPGNLIELEMV